MVKIGVFDSGVGGLSVAHAIEQALPDHEVIFVNDTKHVPYGTKTVAEIKSFVLPILSQLVKDGCAVIVIACNTVTTNLIDELREQLPVPLIGVEPMVKTAAEQTQTGVIAVCATRRTLVSPRYAWLKQTYAKNITVFEPDCSNWTSLIEAKQMDKQTIAHQIEAACNAGADVIVLGCTHYHWIEDIITELANGRAVIMQPEKAVVAQLKRVLEQLG